MPLRTSGLEEPAINMTPMIDVVFLLIIFFMVGSKFTELEQQVDIKLPTTSLSKPLTEPPDPIFITVMADGRMFLGKEPSTAKELEQRLIQAKNRFAEQAVIVRGQGTAEYQTVMDAVEIIERVGIVHFSLATRFEDE